MTESFQGGHHFNKHRSGNRVHQAILSRYREAVRRMLAPTPGDLILDVGCGEGDLIRWLCESSEASFIGCEFSRDVCTEFASIQRDHPGRVFAVRADGTGLPFRAKQFSKVSCFQVLEHIEAPDEMLDSLTEMCHGTVCLSVPLEPLWRILNFCSGRYLSAFGNTPGHVNHWSARTFRSFVSNRLTDIDIDTSAAPFLLARGRCR